MNHIYRSIWNATLGCWVAAPETSCAGKSSIKRNKQVKRGGFEVNGGFLLPILALSLVTGNVLAQSYQTWTGAVSSNWLDAGNWNNGAPTSADVSMINGTVSPSSQPLINSGNINVGKLLVDSGGEITVSNSGSLIVNDLISLGRQQVTNVPGGKLSVLSGGKVVADSIYLGDGINGGRAIVSGLGSTLTINQINNQDGGRGRFVVGGWGDGLLTVKNSGVIFAGGSSLLELGNFFNNREASGILKIGDGELSGDISVAAIKFNTAGSSIIADFSDSMTLRADISGSGSLVKNGVGTLTLTGASSYTGGTEIQAGTLAVQSGGSLSSATALNVASGATFDISAAGSNQAVGSVAGAGTLALGSYVLNAGSNNGSTIFSGRIAGPGTGGLTKSGTGSLTLSGNNSSYTGNTQVDGGTLLLASTGRLGGVVTVASGATLAGTGEVGTAGRSTIIQRGATLAGGGDGSSYGVFTVAGDLEMQNGAILQVQANPSNTQASKVDVIGTATLTGSRVQHVGNVFNAASDFQTGVTYTILTASQITGRFQSVATDYAYLNATLGYLDRGQVVTDPALKATDVTLTLKRKANVGFADLANTPNQSGVANAIAGLPQANALYQYIETLPAGTPAAVFSSLSGDSHANWQSGLQALSARAAGLGAQRMHSNLTAGYRPGAAIAQSDGPLPASAWPTSKALPAWAEVVGHRQSVDGDGNAGKLTQNVYGLFVGADEEVGSNGWRMGGSLGFTTADAKVKARDASADTKSYSASVYTGKGFSHGMHRVNVMGGLAYTHHRISSERNVAGLSQNLKAKYNANTLQLFGEVGYAMGQYSKQGVEPFAGINITQQRMGSFQETGGFAALRGSSSNDTTTSTTLGVRAHSDFKLVGKDARLKGTLGWRHAFGDVKQTATMAFEGSSSFTVTGAPLARNTALVGLQAEVELSRRAALELGYQGEYASGSRDHAMNVKMRWAY